MPSRYFLQSEDKKTGLAAFGIDSGILKQKKAPHQWNIPDTMGAGQIRVENVLAGMELWSIEGRFAPDIHFVSADKRPILCFGYLLEGASEAQYCGTQIRMKAGQQIIFSGPDQHGEGKPRSQHFFRHVSLCCSPEQFALLIGDELETNPSLHCLFSGDSPVSFHIADITPAMQVCLYQLLSCSYTGISRRLFLESRALELLSHQLEPLLATCRTAEKRPLRSSEAERTEHARNLLIADLENPPGLLELASSVGMSHSKLNRCFKQMYGLTPFACLRKERLGQARVLLLNNNSNVTEVAYSVGYSSLSHFAKAYRGQFGELPGACLRH